VKENKYQEYQTRSFQEYESSIILFWWKPSENYELV
jgi:hypothetical protein